MTESEMNELPSLAAAHETRQGTTLPLQVPIVEQFEGSKTRLHLQCQEPLIPMPPPVNWADLERLLEANFEELTLEWWAGHRICECLAEEAAYLLQLGIDGHSLEQWGFDDKVCPLCKVEATWQHVLLECRYWTGRHPEPPAGGPDSADARLRVVAFALLAFTKDN
ncbi:hypothetical protein AK812_SmicGene45898, partial [Symbiodinium microadriaticum]